MSSQQSRRVWKWLAIVGLPVILLLAQAARTKGFTKNRFNLWNRFVINRSRYSLLLPYIIAQAKHETGNLQSRVYLTDNNLFGMKIPQHRKWIGSIGLKAPDGGNYSHYTSDTKSIRDLFLYFDYVGFPQAVSSPEQYVHELKKRNYFGYPGDNSETAYLANFKRYLA